VSLPEVTVSDLPQWSGLAQMRVGEEGVGAPCTQCVQLCVWACAFVGRPVFCAASKSVGTLLCRDQMHSSNLENESVRISLFAMPVAEEDTHVHHTVQYPVL
jgi:hypothetical protein